MIVQSSIELGTDDVSLLERCPYFRQYYVQSWELKMCPISLRVVSSFQRMLYSASMELCMYLRYVHVCLCTGPSGSCSGVVCPSPSYSTCSGVKPWSACCPKCGELGGRKERGRKRRKGREEGRVGGREGGKVGGKGRWRSGKGKGREERKCHFISFVHFNTGGHLTILMDENNLDINSNVLGQEVLSSIDIIGRLRHYITSVSVKKLRNLEVESTRS